MNRSDLTGQRSALAEYQFALVARNQADLDRALQEPGVTIIIDSPPDIPLVVPATAGGREIQARGESSVIIGGRAYVKAVEQCMVEAHGNVKVWAADRAGVIARDWVKVWASGEAVVVGYDNSTVDAVDTATVTAAGHTFVEARGHAHVNAYGWSRVFTWDQATAHKGSLDAVVVKNTSWVLP
jgi:hypothetical protein